MKLVFHFILAILYFAATNSSVYSSLKNNLASYFTGNNRQHKLNKVEDSDDDSSPAVNERNEHNRMITRSIPQPPIEPITPKQNIKNKPWSHNYQFRNDEVDPREVKVENDDQRVKAIKSKIKRQRKNVIRDKSIAEFEKNEEYITVARNVRYRIDPVLNVLRSQPGSRKARVSGSNIIPSVRRQAADEDDTSESAQTSSSREMADFKQEFRNLWLHKKFEAINKSMPHGDKVNMLAARPWGVPCGDPNQHDMPWGTCMLSFECDPEFRIYRGDFFCGRTQFICCALQVTAYDTYQGFDVSFDDKSLSTDSEEKHERKKHSKEKDTKKADRQKKKRKKERDQRKKKIRKHIKSIIKEITKILNRQFRNGTKQRKKRTKQLKKFIKDLKKQYRKDRQSVKDLHEHDMIQIDRSLMERLRQIQKVNVKFVENATFRDILINGTITKQSARMLLEAYPELDEFLEARRSGGGYPDTGGREKGDYLEYDVEYGYLYY